MACHHCGSDSYRKNGSYLGVQRFICKSCKRSFTDKSPKFSQEIRQSALEMYLNNVGIRKAALFVGASPACILKWIKKAANTLSEQLQQAASQVKDNLPDVIEMDEIYTFVQKNSKEQSSGLLILDDKVVLLRLK
jgi:transposase-like protein